MSLRSDRGIKNALIHRVRRHLSLATIFPRSDAPRSKNNDRMAPDPDPGIASPGSGIVQAVLLPFTGEYPPEELANLHPLPQTDPALLKDAIRSAERSPASSTPTSRLGLPPVPRKSPPRGDAKLDESGWQLLKKIFHRHKEKEAPSQPEQPVSQTLTISPNQEPQTSRLPAESAQTQEATRPASGEIAGPPTAQPRAQVPISRKQSTPPPPGDLPVLLAQQPPELTPNTGARLAAQKGGFRNADQEEDIPQREPSEETLFHPHVDREKWAGTLTQTESDPNGISAIPFVEPASPARPEIQPVPLDGVWPVQRKAQSFPDMPLPREATSPAVRTGLPRPLETPDQDSLHRALKHTTPGQPTNSTIEIIPPRRPRPANPLRAQSQEGPLPKNDAFIETPQPEKTLPPDQQPPEVPEKETPLADFQSSQTQAPHANIPSQPVRTTPPFSPRRKGQGDDPVTIQASPPEGAPSIPQPEPASSTVLRPGSEIPSADLIETDIGPLPADLWRLLDQPPPHKVDREAPALKPLDGPPHAASRVETAISAVEKSRPRPTGTPAPESQALPAIQRSTHSPGVAQARETPTEQAAARRDEPGEDRGQDQAEADTDELARRVYAQIKEFIAVEWERCRWRG